MPTRFSSKAFFSIVISAEISFSGVKFRRVNKRETRHLSPYHTYPVISLGPPPAQAKKYT